MLFKLPDAINEIQLWLSWPEVVPDSMTIDIRPDSEKKRVKVSGVENTFNPKHIVWAHAAKINAY